MKKNFKLVCGAKYKKAKKIIAGGFLIAMVGLLILPGLEEPDPVVFVKPKGEISSGILVTPTPEPSATPVAELKEPVENTFTGDVEENYTPLQGNTPSSDGAVITRNEVVGTEEFQQSHQGEVAVDNSGQEIGWVEDSSLPKQEVTEVKLPESLPQSTPTPSTTSSPVVEETTENSEPAENSVEKQEEQPAPETSAPVVEETQEEAQPEPTPESIPDAQPETDVVIDSVTGEVSGGVTGEGDDPCHKKYGYPAGEFVMDAQGHCALKASVQN